MQEIVLSRKAIASTNRTCYASFGDLGVAVKQLVDEYQDNSEGNTNNRYRRFRTHTSPSNSPLTPRNRWDEEVRG